MKSVSMEKPQKLLSNPVIERGSPTVLIPPPTSAKIASLYSLYVKYKYEKKGVFRSSKTVQRAFERGKSVRHLLNRSPSIQQWGYNYLLFSLSPHLETSHADPPSRQYHSSYLPTLTQTKKIAPYALP